MSSISAPLGGDAVICQNWLLKRSQMTRVFKRRFTILTANGKLFSFRRADLSKPETLIPANASLVWEIRGCTVELASKHGVSTWVLKPSSSSSLQEEVLLRASSQASCANWMNVMSAVARGQIGTLFEDISTLTLQTDLNPRPGNVLYVEAEGNLRPIPSRTGLLEMTIRSHEPGSCITILEYSTSETPEFTSERIPRYTFHKSRTSLPWTECRPQWVVMKTAKGQTGQTGSVVLSVDEGLRHYWHPLRRPLVDDSTFDFSLFKFQIRRLIRIIDLIASAKKEVAAVFEWEAPAISVLWFIYLSLVLLVIPQFSHIIAIFHFLVFVLKQSKGFIPWWQRSVIGEFVTRSFSIRSSRQVDVQTSPPVVSQSGSSVPAISSHDVPQSDSQSATKLGVVVRDAAVHAVQQISGALSGARDHHESEGLKPEIWENQRRLFGGSHFNASNLSVFDRSRWSDESGKVALDPPSTSDWSIDIALAQSDDNGWVYNSRWGSGAWHASFTGWDFVRRRKWVPVSPGDSPALQSQSSPISPPSPQQFPEESDIPQLASLSAVVTTGTDFGSLHGEYDESNTDHQPKLASIGSIFHEFKSTAARAQFEIGDICEEIEKYLSLFSWKDQLISTVATSTTMMLGFGLILIPLNFCLYGAIISFFHTGYRRRQWKRVAFRAATHQHVDALVPEGTDISRLGGIEAHKLCTALHRRTGVNLTQKVLSSLTSREELGIWLCNQNPSLLAYRKWQKRDFIENFIDHIPPQVSVEEQTFFADSQYDRPVSTGKMES